MVSLLFIFTCFSVFAINDKLKDTIIISKKNSPFIVDSDFIVSSNQFLLIKKGVEIIVNDTTNIIVYGKLIIDGSENNPVIIRSESDSSSWGRIILRTKQNTIIRNVEFLNGAFTSFNSNYLLASCNFIFTHNRPKDGYPIIFSHNCISYVANNTITNYTGNYVGEGIVQIGGKAEIYNNKLNYLMDMIEVTRVKNSKICGNYIVNSFDDAIDINASENVSIEDNVITNSSDKGISVGGDQSFADAVSFGVSRNIVLNRNIVVNAKIGISITDSSSVLANKIQLIGCETGCNLYNKTKNGGGFLKIENSIFFNSQKTDMIISDDSKIDVTQCISNTSQLVGKQNEKMELQFDTTSYKFVVEEKNIKRIDDKLFYYQTNTVQLTDTSLPILSIDTKHKVIIDDDRIYADLLSNFNNNIENFKVSIEIRGSSSSVFKKKSYGFSLIDENFTNKKSDLFNILDTKNWVLYSSWIDNSFVRNTLAYSIGKSIGIVSPKFKYINLIINNKYGGIYVLIPKIDENYFIDENCELIFKIDKATGDNNWESIAKSNNGNVLYHTHYPKPNKISYKSKKIVLDNINTLEENITDSTKIDFDSFINYVIINELTKNVDAYRTSQYFYKLENNSKIFAGPIWDFDLSLGKTYNTKIDLVEGFVFNADTNLTKYIPKWWFELLKDEVFKGKLVSRWKLLRQSTLSDENINNLIDSLAFEIKNSVEKNSEIWNKNKDYYKNIEELKKWLKARLIWLDVNISDELIDP